MQQKQHQQQQRDTLKLTQGSTHTTDLVDHNNNNSKGNKMTQLQRSRRRIVRCTCAILLVACVLFALMASDGALVAASGKKKFIKGFILGALLSKSHYPIVYSVPSHGGHGGGHGGGGGHYGW